MNLVNAVVPKAAALALRLQKVSDYVHSSRDRLARRMTIRS